MNVLKRKYFLHKLLTVLLCLLLSCANPVPPSGGPPDLTPPEIVSYEPESGALNFKDNKIEIRFNKWMDRSKVNEGIFVSPSAAIEKSWRGKELRITFTEELDTNTTYVVSLGTDYTDLRGNKPFEDFSIIFSTGNTLDSGAITGKVVSAAPAGAFVYAYKIDEINPDTLNPGNVKPRYRMQCGSNGIFKIPALKPGTYRIIALRDAFRNEIYSEGTDSVGTAYQDVVVSETEQPNILIKIAAPIDRVPPMLFSAEALTQKRVGVAFSEAIDSTSIKSEGFRVYDSAMTDEISVVSAYPSQRTASRIFLVLEQAPDTAKKWIVAASTEPELAVRDLAGNIISDTANRTIFFPVSTIDTVRPRLVSVSVRDSATDVAVDTKIHFIFNIGIDTSDFGGRISSVNLSDILGASFEKIWLSENRLVISPEKKFSPAKWHLITLDLTDFKCRTGMKGADTIVNIHFLTQDTRTRSNLSGKIQSDAAVDYSKCIVITSAKEHKEVYSTRANSRGEWLFEDLPSGEYSFEVFIDENENGKYDFGQPFPFVHSEKFFFLDATVALRPRWGVEDVILKIE